MQVWSKAERLWAVRDGGVWRSGELRGSELLLGGTQVIGPQLDGIAAPADGTVIDIEARAAISSIIERLAEHGLIAS